MRKKLLAVVAMATILSTQLVNISFFNNSVYAQEDNRENHRGEIKLTTRVKLAIFVADINNKYLTEEDRDWFEREFPLLYRADLIEAHKKATEIVLDEETDDNQVVDAYLRLREALKELIKFKSNPQEDSEYIIQDLLTDKDIDNARNGNNADLDDNMNPDDNMNQDNHNIKMDEGWNLLEGEWYYYGKDGEPLRNNFTPDGYKVDKEGKWIKASWKKNSIGWWYEYEDGYYLTNTWKYISSKWYYFDASGYMMTGWQKVSGAWYYMESSGEMATGWKYLSGNWYYLDENGRMQTGWQKISGEWYYMKESGEMVSNQWVGNYYLGSSGSMLTNTTTPDGYKVDQNGKWIN